MKSKAMIAAIAAAASLAAGVAGAQGKVTLRYAHMNSVDSIPGLQAAFFAEKAGEYSGGSLVVEVYPDSRLGSLQEQAEEVSSGVIAFHHNTAGAIGSLFEDFGVLDTPYAYRDLEHLLKVADPASPLMTRLGAGLLKAKGLRVLYTFYFGTRQLTCDRPVRRPEDLAGVKVRAIPFPVYTAAVEALGGIPTPIDWAQTPTALAARVVEGQENPVDIILTSKLYESQPYLILTGHIMAADIVVANDAILRRLSKAQRDAVARAAAEASAYATALTREKEAAELAELRARGMKVIGPAEGLDLEAFRAKARRLVADRFGPKWGAYYALIDGTK